MMKITLLLIGILILFNSCINQSNEDIVLNEPIYFHDSLSRIEGQWYWVKSSGGYSGGSSGPTVDNQIRLKYSMDSVYQYIRSDRVIITSNYSIRNNKSIYQSDSLSFIYYSDTNRHYDVIIRLTKDTLVLADNIYDGFTSIYRKISL